MNILLINMPIRVQARPNVVPTGVGILSSLFRQKGHCCTILDLNIHRPPLSTAEISKKLLGFGIEFDLIGLSGMITTLRWQKLLAALCRELFPEGVLISGGGLASDFGEALFDWIPELNAVALGEGEELLDEILGATDRLRGSRKVFGPKITPDLDTIPAVDWDSFEMETYLSNPVWGAGAGNSSWTPFEAKRSINLISSRGCPYSCRFCDRQATGGRNYRLAGTKRLMEDVREVIDRFQVDFIGFVDDNFIADRARLLDFLPLMKETGILWGCHGRLNEIDEPLAAALRAAGCVYIGFGGESADPEVLKRMNKKNSPTQMSVAVKACQRHGITPNCTWIMGYPGETRESLRKTARFILDHGLSQKNLFVATAYPGTAFFDEVKSKIFRAYASLEEYVLDLDDATKVLEHNGMLLNYSDMSDEEFLECRGYVEAGELGRI
jgi:radical SAM superfamily enzyme YgiQ (UPF0313 family)